MDIVNDLAIASEDENEIALLGRNGQEITYRELCDVADILDAIIDAKGEFTIR